jgi:hypothetical protein
MLYIAASMQITCILATLLFAPRMVNTYPLLYFRVLFGWLFPGILGLIALFESNSESSWAFGATLAILFVSWANSPIGFIVWGLNPLDLSREAKRIKLTLEDGKGLTDDGQTACYGCKKVKTVRIGSEEEAMTVYFDFIEGMNNVGYIRPTYDKNYAFDCRGMKYNVGTDVCIFWNWRGENQWWIFNNDGTVSPFKNCQVVLGSRGVGEGHLCLTRRRRPLRNGDRSRKLVFTCRVPRLLSDEQEEEVELGNFITPSAPPTIVQASYVEIPTAIAKIPPPQYAVIAPMLVPKFCTSCGMALPNIEGSDAPKFCSNCGTKVQGF